MNGQTKVLVRNAREQDIPAVLEIDMEAFVPYGTSEKLETFKRRLESFPNGFVILVAENEIAGFGCSEKWLVEREPGLDEDPLAHPPAGWQNIFHHGPGCQKEIPGARLRDAGTG